MAPRASTEAATPEADVPAPVSTARLKRQDLAEAMAIVAQVAEHRTGDTPALAGVLLETGNARLHLTCSDLDRCITTSIDCDGVLASPVIVNAHHLRDLAKTMAGDQVSISLDSNRLLLNARNGGKRRLPTMSPDDFPRITTVQAINIVTLPRDLLAKALANVAIAQSTEETRYYLNGIYAAPLGTDGDEGLRLVATDGHRLHVDRVEEAEFTQSDWPESFILPTRAVTALLALMKDAGDDVVEVSLAVSARHCEMIVGDVRLWSKLIDGTFPDYLRIMPGTLPLAFEFPAAELLRASAAVEPLASGKTPAIRLDLNTAGSTVKMTDTEYGEAIEPIDDTQLSGGDNAVIGFRAKYLKAALQLFGAERATIELTDGEGQSRITSPAHPGLTIILMPMRV